MAADLLAPLRDELVARGIVRKPSVAGAVATLWLEPRLGTPAPGETPGGAASEASDTVLAAFRDTGVPPRRHEGFVRIDSVTFWIRARTAMAGPQVHDQLRDALNDKRSWTMGGLHIEESLMVRDLQRLRSDESGWTFTTEFTFERWD